MTHSSKPPGGKPKRTSYRSRHRKRSHEEAHDGGHEHVLPNVLEHPLVPAGEPVLVTTQADVDTLVARLRAAGRFAFDTEFIGEETYYPHLCLVQVATVEGITLIDPLAAPSVNLRAFWELIADASIEKTVHAGLQDLEPVVRHVGRPPRSIFDTQLAAGLAGLAYPMSLDKLVVAMAGVEPGRGAKFSHWDQRPLTPVQLRYAANDVRYLPLLRHLIGEKLESLGNTAWATARCDELSDVSLYVFDAQSQRLRIRGVNWLGPRQIAVMRALLAWREDAAREQDVPSRSLVSDGVLFEMAREPVESVADLARVRGLPRPVERRYGQAIVAVTQRALAGPLNPADGPPPTPRIEQDEVSDRFWHDLQQHCRDRGVDPAVVVSKREVVRYIQALRLGVPCTDSVLAQGWRRQFLSPVLDAVDALAGTLRVPGAGDAQRPG